MAMRTEEPGGAPEQLAPTAWERVKHAMAGAQLENGGLQSYRSLHLAVQSILFATGAILFVSAAEASTRNHDNAHALYARAFLIVLLLASFMFVVMLCVIRRRERQVDWWLDQMGEAEQRLPEGAQYWTRYKTEFHRKLFNCRRMLGILHVFVFLAWAFLAVWVCKLSPT